MYLNGAQFVLLPRVIVDHHYKIVSNVALFVATALVALPVRHQCGNVEDSCRHRFMNERRWLRRIITALP